MEKAFFKISSIRQPKELLSILKKTNKELNEFFDMNLKIPSVFFIQSRKQFNELWKMETEDWMVGFADGANIFILDPAVYTKESSHKDINNFYKTLNHEYAHIAIRKYCGHNRPKWLNEGLACYLAKQEKSVPPKENLLKIFDYHQKSDSEIYGIGYFWVKFLIENFGKEKILELLKNINYKTGEKNFAESFCKIYGFNYSKNDFEKLIEL